MAQFEYELLGSLRDEPELIEEYAVTKDIFELPEAKKILAAMVDLRKEGVEKLDDIVLSHALTKHGYSYDQALGILFKIPVGGNVEFYYKKVKDAWIGRRLNMVGEITASSTDSVDERIENLEKMLTELKWDERKMRDLYSVMPEMLESIEKRCKTGNSRAVSTGWRVLDEILCGGVQPQEMMIIGARPGVGKTSLALNIAKNAAAAGRKVGFFSLEMSMVSLAERIMANVSGVDAGKIRAGLLNAADFTHMISAADEIGKMQIVMDDTPGLRLAELKGKARKMRRAGVEIIFVDYLTLVKYENDSMKQYEIIGHIALELKNLARELDVPVVVMSQIKRESTQSGEPDLGDLRKSGDIEEHSDIVMFIWREKGDEDDNLKARVSKGRNCRTGPFNLYFDRSNMRIEEQL